MFYGHCRIRWLGPILSLPHYIIDAVVIFRIEIKINKIWICRKMYLFYWFVTIGGALFFVNGQLRMNYNQVQYQLPAHLPYNPPPFYAAAYPQPPPVANTSTRKCGDYPVRLPPMRNFQPEKTDGIWHTYRVLLPGAPVMTNRQLTIQSLGKTVVPFSTIPAEYQLLTTYSCDNDTDAVCSCNSEFYPGIAGTNGYRYFNRITMDCAIQPAYITVVACKYHTYCIAYSCAAPNYVTDTCTKPIIFVSTRARPDHMADKVLKRIDQVVDMIFAPYCKSRDDIPKQIYTEDKPFCPLDTPVPECVQQIVKGLEDDAKNTVVPVALDVAAKGSAISGGSFSLVGAQYYNQLPAYPPYQTPLYAAAYLPPPPTVNTNTRKCGDYPVQLPPMHNYQPEKTQGLWHTYRMLLPGAPLMTNRRLTIKGLGKTVVPFSTTPAEYQLLTTYSCENSSDAVCSATSEFYPGTAGANGYRYYNKISMDCAIQPAYFTVAACNYNTYCIVYSCAKANYVTEICVEPIIFVSTRARPDQMPDTVLKRIDQLVDTIFAPYCKSRDDIPKQMYTDDKPFCPLDTPVPECVQQIVKGLEEDAKTTVVADATPNISGSGY
ncbi:uncharacterized protein LOC129583476 [Paramacrobiotus metropolitanus]|uniref:uncharacterized protein LOC129583476 n=1 Tax=Paramacrobiotus metropolitanus TaxID=2943436 RepID=UPI002445C4B9|nr:uncharacterized protein LOC129583476 [Paramacrobiotus metropolitanus]